ncbi:MAG: hypothetical protein LLG97_09005 [Deltaproteobacteria bacterium]|nr:hypothetical protein [Deltaproteobacteria bacterium]
MDGFIFLDRCLRIRKQFYAAVSAFAAKALSNGLVRGDIIATTLPLRRRTSTWFRPASA